MEISSTNACIKDTNMDGYKKDSNDQQNAPREAAGDTNLLATQEEREGYDDIKRLIQDLKRLTTEYKVHHKKAVLQYRKVVQAKEHWLYEGVMWERRYNLLVIELAEWSEPHTPKEQSWQRRQTLSVL